MKTKVCTPDVNSSNAFLRALWAELRAQFGKCTWFYSPHKIGKSKLIFLGTLDLGLRQNLTVSLSYNRKGDIQEIFFNFADGDNSKDSEINTKITSAIKKAIKNAKAPQKIFVTGYIENLHGPLHNYSANDFSIMSTTTDFFSRLEILTSAYDEVDAKAEFLTKANYFIDVLSVETNLPFWLASQSADISKEQIEKEYFINDKTWIDGFPVIENGFVISETGKKLLSLIAKDELSKDLLIFLNACNHFHTARKYDAQIYDQIRLGPANQVTESEFTIPIFERDNRLSHASSMGSTHNEIATVLYMSALEVVANIGIEAPKNCEACGQTVYKIRQRVQDLANRFLPDFAVKKFLIENYDKRSKYLHSGVLLTQTNYKGKSIPLLDVNDPSGCRVVSQVPLVNIREFTSYCLRNLLYSMTDVGQL